MTTTLLPVAGEWVIEPDNRVREVDRDAVMHALREAVAQGWLSRADAEARWGRCYAASSVGELVPWVSDLPNSPSMATAPSVPDSQVSGPIPMPGTEWDAEPGRLGGDEPRGWGRTHEPERPVEDHPLREEPVREDRALRTERPERQERLERPPRGREARERRRSQQEGQDPERDGDWWRSLREFGWACLLLAVVLVLVLVTSR